MTGILADIRFWTARRLSAIAASVDGVQSSNKPRGSQYDEQYVISSMAKKYPGVDGGEYRIASMTPSQTALQVGISASYSAILAALAFKNGAAAAQNPGKRCYLDYIRMVVVTPPTSGTELLGATAIDSGSRSPTTISSGSGGTGPGTAATATAYRAPVVDPNMDSVESAIGIPYFPFSTAAGTPVAIAAASTDARLLVGNLPIRAQIPVASDEYVIDFGSGDPAPSGGLVTAAPAGASRVVCAHPGVVLGPQHWFLLHLWSPSNVTAGLAFKGLDMGWWER